MKSVDVGSMPFQGDHERLDRGAGEEADRDYFEETILAYFIGKLEAGLDVATYPQLRDMCKMFLEAIDGLAKVDGRYAAIDHLKPRLKGIPEVDAITRHAKEVYDATGRIYSMRVCITGPYTLSTLLLRPDEGQILELAEALTTIAEGSLQGTRYGGVEVLVVEEPILGVVDDARLDYRGGWYETLLEAWDRILYPASCRGILCGIHLHSTSNNIFWSIDRLNIIELGAEDPLFASEKTPNLLRVHDKALKASICVTDVDRLAAKAAQSIEPYSRLPGQEGLGRLWADITRGRADPAVLLEDRETISKRLSSIVERIGRENLPYAGPECGLKGFITLENALTLLKRCSEVVKAREE